MTFQKWPKLATIQRLQPLQNLHFESKIKIIKNVQKTILEPHQSCSVQKKLQKKTPNIRKMTIFPKWPKFATMQRLKALQNRHFGSNIKIVKNMRKTTLEPHRSCSVQKTAPKNTQYSKNDNISKLAKLGHHVKAFGKSSL